MIYLLRHGLDDERYIGGWSDVSLIEEGKKQVIGARDFLETSGIKFDRIISSDIKRAHQTAELIAEKFPLKIEDTPLLRELNKGLLNGVKKDNVPAEYHEFLGDVSIDTVYPEGESMTQFYERISASVDKILELDSSLLVTHRGVINMLYFILNGIKLCNDKKMFGVTHASVHELDPIKKTIKRIY